MTTIVIVEVMVLLAWIGVGVAVELFAAVHHRHAGWFAAAALLGPFWWIVLADRRALAGPQTERSFDSVRSADLERGRAA